MRPWLEYLDRKSFSLDFMAGAAQLFTVGCGELFRALLAAG
jgi:hypothetical protein